MATAPLPHLASDRLFLTDGGMETTLIYRRGVELPGFAVFPLVDDEAGRAHLRAYYEPYLAIAREHGAAFALDTGTWRANEDWGAQLGYDADALARVNRDAVAFARELAAEHADVPMVINATVGPRGDGYLVDTSMTPEEAERYHRPQVNALAEAGADMLGALTLTYSEEAAGIARAAQAAKLPVAISFTLETDGRLPSGETLGAAIEHVDALTDGGPAFYMINCAHPSHFAAVLEEGGPWLTRLLGLRANASSRSHEELDALDELDTGDPDELAAGYRALRPLLPHANVIGGCCGTDERHIAAVAAAWLA